MNNQEPATNQNLGERREWIEPEVQTLHVAETAAFSGIGFDAHPKGQPPSSTKS